MNTLKKLFRYLIAIVFLYYYIFFHDHVNLKTMEYLFHLHYSRWKFHYFWNVKFDIASFSALDNPYIYEPVASDQFCISLYSNIKPSRNSIAKFPVNTFLYLIVERINLQFLKVLMTSSFKVNKICRSKWCRFSAFTLFKALSFKVLNLSHVRGSFILWKFLSRLKNAKI